MQNFEFDLPTKVVFGRDMVSRIGPEIAPHCRRVLLVYGEGSAKRNGVYDTVCAALRQAGVDWVEYSGVKSNPELRQVRAAVEIAKREAVQGILGIGGGSAVDLAKAAAVGAANDGDLWAFFVDRPVETCLPVFAVLTLAATGTELNGTAVVTNERTREKWAVKSPLIRPRVSVLDPTTTFSVPPDYTAYGGVDAFSHVIEAYLVWPEPSTPVQDRLAEALAAAIVTATEQCLAEPCDYEARAALMWAAALGWCGLVGAGAGRARLPNHMIEHSLSALYDVPHGAGLSAVIPGWAWTMIETGSPKRFAQLARRVFGVTETNDAKAAALGITAFEDWCVRIGSPTRIAQLGIDRAELPNIVANVSNNATRAWGLGETYTPAFIETVLRRCF